MERRTRRSTRSRTIIIDINAANIEEPFTPQILANSYTSTVRNSITEQLNHQTPIQYDIICDSSESVANPLCLQKEKISDNTVQIKKSTDLSNANIILTPNKSVKELIYFYNNLNKNNTITTCNIKCTTTGHVSKCITIFQKYVKNI